MIILGYFVGVAMAGVGLTVLLRIYDPQGGVFADPTARTVFGIVLLLYGIYRLAITETQRRRAERSK